MDANSMSYHDYRKNSETVEIINKLIDGYNCLFEDNEKLVSKVANLTERINKLELLLVNKPQEINN
jgi:hypothetical protein